MGFDMSIVIGPDTAQRVETCTGLEENGEEAVLWWACSLARPLHDALVLDMGPDDERRFPLDAHAVRALAQLRRDLAMDETFETLADAARVRPSIAREAWEELPALDKARIAALFATEWPETARALFGMIAEWDDSVSVALGFLDAMTLLDRAGGACTVEASW